jgi:hypothetical protein
MSVQYKADCRDAYELFCEIAQGINEIASMNRIHFKNTQDGMYTKTWINDESVEDNFRATAQKGVKVTLDTLNQLNNQTKKLIEEELIEKKKQELRTEMKIQL